VKEAVNECALHYKFDCEEAMHRLNLNDVKISQKKEKKVLKEKCVSVSFPLPFNGVKREGCCSGLKQNHGLYTQCMKVVSGEEKYCKTCEKEALKNDSGKPNCGSIEDRLAVGLMEFRDPKGKAPTPYAKIMKKMNLSKEEVILEGKKINEEILEEHFKVEEEKRGRPKAIKEKVEKEEKKKGRPLKSKKILEVKEETTDLFAELIAAAASSSEEVKEAVVEEVKVDKKALKEQEKAKKEEEKKALKEAEKAKKEALKEQEKAKKEEEKKALKEAEKAKKEAEKKPKKEEKKVEEEADVVKKFEYEGTKYLKSKKTGIVYNMEQEVVGKWDEERKKIIFDEEESDEEEEEEEYEE
jgi:hypothetical protein